MAQVTIDIRSGPLHDHAVSRADVQKNIAALQRVVKGQRSARDDILIIDTIGILKAIKDQLPKQGVKI